MEINQLNVLIDAVQVATKRGAFTLLETKPILVAVEFFIEASKAPQNVPQQELPVEKVEDTKEE